MTAREILIWPIDRLQPYGRNSRTHSPEQVDKIVALMNEFGWTQPILADQSGSIVAGHGRRLAALQIYELGGVIRFPDGAEIPTGHVPVIDVTGWSETQRRAYVIADNQSALAAGWDNELLALELGELRALDFDLSLTAFDQPELDAIFSINMGAGHTDPDDAPPPSANKISKRGDIWMLGNHRIMCGDSCNIEDVERLLDGVTPDLANCDPPYGINVVKGTADGVAKPFGKVGGGNAPFGGWKDGDRSKGAKQGRGHGPARNAIIQPGVYDAIIGDDTIDTAVNSYQVLIEIGVPVICLWGGNYFANALPNSRCWLVWDKKTNGTFADAELAWTNRDAVVEVFEHQWSGLIKASERGERRVHPTQKPVALAEWVIETLAPDAKTVIDLFVGSGSTLMACERKGIAFFGMEMAESYVDVSIRRWQAFTGLKATLEATGETFDDVAKASEAA